MPTEVWYRNPHNYIRELVETGKGNIVWDKGMLLKRKIEPHKHANVYFGSASWRSLVVADTGSYEVGRDGKIVAAYPTWVYGDDLEYLEELLEYPVGERKDVVGDYTLDDEDRPRSGQEHRVVVMGLPPMESKGGGPGREILKILKELQKKYPKCILHLHGTYSYRVAFQNGMRSADTDPRTPAAKGKLVLPNGSEIPYDSPKVPASWITTFGQTYADMHVARERCMYNIRSAEYAASESGLAIEPMARPNAKPDVTTPDLEFIRSRSTRPFLGSAKALPGDKFFCDECSLRIQCKVYRKGSVCVLPSAETTQLVKLFGSRDSSNILDGMSKLMQMGAERLGTRMEQEAESDEISPEVTKMMNTLFDQGAKLAKLTDPALRGGIKVNVGVVTPGGAPNQIQAGSPRQLIKGIMAEFEAAGFERSEITPEMITEAMAAMGHVGPSAANTQVRGEIVGGE